DALRCTRDLHSFPTRRSSDLLVMRMCALAVNAEPVQGRRERRGEVAVGAAAGDGVDKLEADLFGERARMFEQRSTGVALDVRRRSEEHTSELQSLAYLVCRLL